MKAIATLITVSSISLIGCGKTPTPLFELNLSLTGALAIARIPHTDTPREVWVFFPSEKTTDTRRVTGDGDKDQKLSIDSHFAMLRIPGRYLGQPGLEKEGLFVSLDRTDLSIEAEGGGSGVKFNGADYLASVTHFLSTYKTPRKKCFEGGLDPALASRFKLTTGEATVKDVIQNGGSNICWTFHAGGGASYSQYLGQTLEVAIVGHSLPRLRIRREIKDDKGTVQWESHALNLKPILENGRMLVHLDLFDSPLDVILGDYKPAPAKILPHFVYSYDVTDMPGNYASYVPVPVDDNQYAATLPAQGGGHPYCTLAELEDPTHGDASKGQPGGREAAGVGTCSPKLH